jgi:hypothetical protein
MKRKIIQFTLFFGAAALLSGLAPSHVMAQTGTIQGTVTDASSGLPLEGVWVGARPVQDDPDDRCGGGGHGGGHGLHGVTAEDGTYLIENVPVGDYSAMAKAEGYLPSDPVDVTIQEDQTTTRDFELEVRSGIFSTMPG